MGSTILLTAQKEVNELESLLKETSFNIEAEKSELYKVSSSQKIKETNFESAQNNLEKLEFIKNRFISYKSRNHWLNLNAFPIQIRSKSKIKFL